MIRVFINGFGRIGRHAARIILEDQRFELVGINDPGSFDQMASLLQRDSVYGDFHQSVKVEKEQLCIDGKAIPLFNVSDPSALDLHKLDTDIVLACCGMFLTQRACQPFIDKGARKVIISTPSKDEMPTFIYGVNHDKYRDEAIISNSSCSANAIVPIFKIVDKAFGIESAMLSMYHSYTSYQRLLDTKHYASDIRRTRSATQNIIPLQSSAATATARFFPHLREKLYAKSIRVPLPAVTLYNLSISLQKATSMDEVSRTVESEIKFSWQGILDVSHAPEVSSDYIQNPYSAVIDSALISVSEDTLLRIGAWQDNEYGYARRLIDMAAVVGKEV